MNILCVVFSFYFSYVIAIGHFHFHPMKICSFFDAVRQYKYYKISKYK